MALCSQCNEFEISSTTNLVIYEGKNVDDGVMMRPANRMVEANVSQLKTHHTRMPQASTVSRTFLSCN